MAQVFAAFGKFQQNNKGSVQNFGIIGITITAEEITKFIFFYCPCNYPMNQVYGSTFIWGPAAILLVVGYVINRRTWRLMTGMCNRTQGVGKGGKRIFHFLFIFANISMKAILAPATWIVLSFLKGDYYACAAWPSPFDRSAEAKFRLPVNSTIPRPCDFNVKPITFLKEPNNAEIIARDLRAVSHIIGWWFLTWTLLIGIFFVFIFRCLSKYSYEQSKYIEKYRTSEMQLFEEALDAKAMAQAKITVDQFFSKPRSKEEWDQIAVINDKVMKSKRGRPIYSPMHKFSNKELVALELAETDIVASSAQKKHHFSNLIAKKKAGSKWPDTSALKAKKTPTNQPVEPPSTTNTGSTGAPLLIPMVSMAPKQKVVVRSSAAQQNMNPQQQQSTPKPTEKPAEQGANNPTVDDKQNQNPPITTPETASPHVTEVQADVSPGDISPGSRPPSYIGESDPVLEANAPDRGSVVIPVGDNEEDPILEASVAVQAEEIRRSMQSLDNDGDLENATDQIPFGEVAPDDDDSQPLI